MESVRSRCRRKLAVCWPDVHHGVRRRGRIAFGVFKKSIGFFMAWLKSRFSMVFCLKWLSAMWPHIAIEIVGMVLARRAIEQFGNVVVRHRSLVVYGFH